MSMEVVRLLQDETLAVGETRIVNVDNVGGLRGFFSLQCKADIAGLTVYVECSLDRSGYVKPLGGDLFSSASAGERIDKIQLPICSAMNVCFYNGGSGPMVLTASLAKA